MKARLLKMDREILNYILKNRKHACFQTASEIADILGTSASSVVRLSKKLGYQNFAVFKRTLQQEVACGGDAAVRAPLPYDRIKKYENLSDEEALAAYTQNALFNVGTDSSPDTDEKLGNIADLVVRARNVYVVGFRSCYGYASTMGVMLSCMRPGVAVVGHNRPLVESLLDMGPKDTMIAVSFARYSGDTAFAAGMARDAGCPVVAMTDSYAAPIAQGASHVVVNSIGNLSFFDSYVSFVMNMEKILLLVSKRSKKKSEARLLRMEEYLKKTGQY